MSPEVQAAWDAVAARGLTDLDMPAFHRFVFAAFEHGEHPDFARLFAGAQVSDDARARITAEFQKEWELLAEYEAP